MITSDCINFKDSLEARVIYELWVEFAIIIVSVVFIFYLIKAILKWRKNRK